MNGALLSIEGLSKRFGDVEALSMIDLDVSVGEFVSLLGPSGCWKTTLLKIVAGFETATAGRVSLDGGDLLQLAPHRRPVNTVFQRYLLFPHLSVEENVAYGLRFDRTPRGEIAGRVKGALELVQLSPLAKRRSDQLSGGQAQRVSLARALVKRPRVLLLDEPLSALDLETRVEMQRELRTIHREVGTTFLYVTHDQQEAMYLSDRVAVMDHGRIEQVGTPEEIYRAPANRHVAKFVGDANLVPYARSSTRPGVAVALGGMLEAPIGDTAPATGVLVIRSEALTLVPAPSSGSLVVTDAVFMGASTAYTVDADGMAIRATVESEAVEDSFVVGDHVRIALDGTEILALP